MFGQIASGNFFDVLGPQMAAGRTFRADEDQTPGASPVAVITYGLWQRRFGGDPNIVGQSITVNGRPFAVIGVTGEGFRGTATLGGPELWVPLSMYREILSGPEHRLLQLAARAVLRGGGAAEARPHRCSRRRPT